MKNLIFQYYIPYEGNDSRLGGQSMPKWAVKGMESAQKYAKAVGADYLMVHDKYFPELDPRLETLRIHHDPYFEKYDKVLALDVDMTVDTRMNIFNIPIKDVAMVHENGIFQYQYWLVEGCHECARNKGVSLHMVRNSLVMIGCSPSQHSIH